MPLCTSLTFQYGIVLFLLAKTSLIPSGMYHFQTSDRPMLLSLKDSKFCPAFRKYSKYTPWIPSDLSILFYIEGKLSSFVCINWNFDKVYGRLVSNLYRI